MKRIQRLLVKVQAALIVSLLLISCGGSQTEPPVVPTATLPELNDLPKITSMAIDRSELPRYESLELTVGVDAEYSNPFDAREVKLQAVFTTTDGQSMSVPGFWDGEEAWKVRFTPFAEGKWSYSVYVVDGHGQGLPYEGGFSVTGSDLHGWLITGNRYDPSYSGHYLVQHDGTPFYGVGHCDALNILVDGFDMEDGVRLFDNMKAAGENYVVWWPLYTNSFIGDSYDRYLASNMKIIDLIVSDAQKAGVFIVFTVWDHPNLRDETHPWGNGRWGLNGFSKMGAIDTFFTSDEAWAWQENLYRYIIARWGFSPAIGMWQTVTEINGTNSYSHTDEWHKKVNDYFVANDPYHHPTTASGSGEWDWPAGHQVMDVSQVHLYDWENGDVVHAAEISATWTRRMWERVDHPNWIGEFGVPDNTKYPELFHNVIWAALASGAGLTPAEWNDSSQWGRMTPEMNADTMRLSNFVFDLPLARWDPVAMNVTSTDPQVRGWGLAGSQGGVFWVQDYSLEGKSINDVRNSMPVRRGVEIELTDLVHGTYTITPYDTWKGIFGDPFEMTCQSSICKITLPEFRSDMAFKILIK